MPRKRINAKTKIEDPWKALSGAITDTLLAKETSFNTTMIQQACYDLVNKKQFDTLYNGLLEILTSHFREWHDQLRNVAGDPLLTKLSDQFENFQYISTLIPTFYSSYNQHYNSDSKTISIIRKLFIQEILSDEQLFKKAATPSLLEVIHNAQKGSEVDLSKAKNIIQMYYLFSGKNDKPEIFLDFFDRFKNQENDFCDTFYNNNFATSSFTTYLTNVQKQFNIINHILNEKQLLRKPEANEVLTSFNISLLHSREDDFLKGESPPISTALTADDLRPMKYLVDTYEHFDFPIEPLYKACAHYIRSEMLKKTQDFPQVDEEGKGKEKEKEKAKESKEKGKKGKKESNILTLVGSLIELTLHLIEPYKKIFVNEEENNKAFEKLNKCIVKAWNDKRFNICINFNDYIDSLVTNKFKGYDTNNMAEKLKTEIIPQFYQYITDKAKFNLYYESSFVRRLVQMRSTIEEYDYPIINCIQKFNHEFMKKLDDFKKALVDSDQLREDFKAAYPESDKNVQIEPFVFDYNVYPLQKDRFDCVPSMAVESNNQFQSFYHSKHQKKSLELIYQGSLAEFSIKILRRKTYTFIVDLPCACVISALSIRPHKFAEIIEILGNNKTLANKVILKLYQKTKIIIPKEKISKLTNDDIFIINPSYSSDKSRLIVSPVIQGQWRDHIPSVYEQEKKEAIKCAIVRVLKQKQKMNNDEMERVIMGRLQSKYDINAEQIRREAVLLENQFIKSETIDGQKIITYIG